MCKDGWDCWWARVMVGSRLGEGAFGQWAQGGVVAYEGGWVRKGVGTWA